MTSKLLNWSVGYTDNPEKCPAEIYPAVVPGNVQMDYARAKQWEHYSKGLNSRNYRWMEDVWWLYRAPLDFTLEEGQIASLVFKGIDYQYEIRVGNQVLHKGTGMFSTIRCDVTSFAGKDLLLEILVYPAPKYGDSEDREQARKSFKPCVCYGWDYHPRIIPLGIWDEACLEISEAHSICALDAFYRLNDDFSLCEIETILRLNGSGKVSAELLDGEVTVAAVSTCTEEKECKLKLILASPKLWYPTGYGEQHCYILRARTLNERGVVQEEKTRSIGFRRSKLVMNEDSWKYPDTFSKGRSDAPATLEINGCRIFAKGSNWVNAQIFHGDMNRENYRMLLSMVRDANMNILRVHGGGPVNKECFYELCDEMGIMVWQEFPLACNEYPDEDEYLDVLKQDAADIICRLRTHPCLVMWCGGNELFNVWSGMTEQHHALRLLDSLCYEYDRFTPFNMTSPLVGMSHGNYVNYDEGTGREFITDIVKSRNTAYTEFGSPGMADVEYLRTFMSEEDINDCCPDNPVWLEHHGFHAWFESTWVRKTEAEYYFGGYDNTEDLCNKTQFIQAMCYRSLFEEMRKQWPHCSMALNWCFNEPWPTAANNSLVSWPTKPKPAYYAVQKALRSQMASLRVDHHLWWSGDRFKAEVWLLNDAPEQLNGGQISVYYAIGEGKYIRWGILDHPVVEEQTNFCCGEITFLIPEGFEGKIHVWLKADNMEEMDSQYTYLCRKRKNESEKRLLNL